MAHKDQVSVRLALVHPDEAMRILEVENFIGQRPRRAGHVKFLAQAMEHERFIPGTAIHFAVYQGKRHLVNGQHTLAAIEVSRHAQLLAIHETQVTSPEQIAELYSRHDRGLQRQLMDGYVAHQFAERHGLSRAQAGDFGGAMPLVLSGFTAASSGGQNAEMQTYLRDTDIRLAAMREWVQEAREFYEEISFSPPYIMRALHRQSVVSIALVTYRYTGADASEFWREVAKDNGLAATHPAKRLIRFLLDNPARSHSPRIYARYVAACWNAAFEDRSLTKVYARDAMLPIVIAGTPFNGKQFCYFLSEEGSPLHDPRLVEPQDFEGGMVLAGEDA